MRRARLLMDSNLSQFLALQNYQTDDDDDDDDDDNDTSITRITGFPFLAFSSQVEKESTCTLSRPFRTLSRLIVTGDIFLEITLSSS